MKQQLKFIGRNFKIIIFFIISAVIFNLNHTISSDEGTVLSGAWNIFNGQNIYHDFFSYVAPGSFYFIKTSFDIFGPYYWAAKLFSLALLVISVFAIYQVTIILGQSHTIAKLTAWLWMFLTSFVFPIINYNSHSTYLTLIALWLFLIALKLQRKIYFLLGGLFFGVVIIFLQHKGIIISSVAIAILSVLLFLKKIKLNHLIITLFAICLLPALTTINLGPSLLFQNLILWPVRHSIAYNPISVFGFFLLFSFFTASFLFTYLKQENIRKDFLIIVYLFQLALWLTILLFRRDPYYFVINSPLFLLVVIIPIHIFISSVVPRKFYKFIIFFMAFYLILISTLNNYEYLKYFREFKYTTQKYNFEKIYVHPFSPGIYFELKIKNPYPYDITITRMHPQEAFLANLEVFKKQMPDYVLTNYIIVKKYNYNLNNPLDIYIHENYQKIDGFSSTWILKRKDLLLY